MGDEDIHLYAKWEKKDQPNPKPNPDDKKQVDKDDSNQPPDTSDKERAILLILFVSSIFAITMYSKRKKE